MILKLIRTPGIYLVGFMASGKSTIGRALGEELGWAFVDLDEDIERDQGASISDIFERQGEEEFRRIETAAIRKRIHVVQSGRPMVISLGGGAFTRTENIELLENNGVAIWLDCPWPMVERRVSQATHRPLARDPHKLEELYTTRLAFYAKADFRVPVESDDAAPIVQAILRLPIF